MVSGTISLPSPGCFSPFPHGTGSLSVAKEYLALGDGPPGFPQGSTCPAVLRIASRKAASFRLRGSHPLWLTFPGHSSTSPLAHFPRSPYRPQTLSSNPRYATRTGLHTSGLGSSHFARRYFENRDFFLFLRVLRCFTSPRSLPQTYIFSKGISRHYPGWVAPFGYLRIKACLAAPRNFSQLTASFIAFWRQGIHHLPLVA